MYLEVELRSSMKHTINIFLYWHIWKRRKKVWTV